MPLLELSFASKQDSLSVREFNIREQISGLFELQIIARSELDDIDLDAIVGHGAAFKIVTGLRNTMTPSRVWTGICSQMEQIQPEPSKSGAKALSTYYLRIVPALWRTTLRRNSRIFQHKSVPEIVQEVLGGWQIVPELKLEKYPSLEYRVQYGETDFDFVNRLLEESGISYLFEFEEGETRLVLSDKPHKAESRPGQPIHYVDNPNQEAEEEFLTHVHLAHQVRPGRVTVRDFDFRTKPDVELLGHAKAKSPDEHYELYHYAPGAFLVEPAKDEAPVANDPGSRFDEDEAAAHATRALEAARRDRRTVSFQTNVLDLSPGVIFKMDRHPRRDLASDKRLLVTERRMEGSPTGEWRIGGVATFADDPYRPARHTPKPKIYGVQSALVVGPPGDEEIYTDEFGRVRVQFHWDREGKRDDKSSCWIRVSQGWAGASYGMMAIPRVGHEVLVEFYDGDPDSPVITGRVYNNTMRVPWKLPDDKTKSGWKSDTSKGSNGYNELTFDDAKGKELVNIQAQRNLTKVVKVDEVESVGQNRTTNVGNAEATFAGARHLVQVGKVTGVETTDGKILISTGKASILLYEDTIHLDADKIFVRGGTKVTVHGSGAESVVIDGTPKVLINCGSPEAPKVQKLPDPGAAIHGGSSKAADHLLTAASGFDDPGGFDKAEVPPDAPMVDKIVKTPPETPAAAPQAVKVSPEANQELNQEAAAASEASGPPEASRAVLVANQATSAMQLVKAGKDVISEHSIANITTASQMVLGGVMTKPIPAIGGLSGGDVAEVLNAGNSVGIFQFGGQKGGASAGAAPAAAAAQSGPAPAPAAGPRTEGAGQYMAMRTQAAPSHIDAAKLDAQQDAYRSVGMSHDKAAAHAMNQQGVALYKGDFRGNFVKVPH